MDESSNQPPSMPDEQPSTTDDNGSIYQRSGKITFCLENAKDFLDGKFGEFGQLYPSSPPIYLNGLPWQLEFCLCRTVRSMGIGVRCMGDLDDKAWSCSAFFEISLFSTALRRNIKQYECRHTFNSEESKRPYFVHVEELADPKLQFIDLEKDTVIASAEIIAEEPRGLGEIRNEGVLKVNRTPINVNKHNLAAYSSYFRTLFFGDNAPEIPEIQIDDLPDGVKHFKRMIATMSPENEELDDECIEPVLHLANRFLVSTVENRCVKFLSEKSQKSPIFKLRLADKYGFSALKKHLLRNLTREDFTGEKYTANVSEQSKMSQEAADELMGRCDTLFRLPLAKRARRN